MGEGLAREAIIRRVLSIEPIPFSRWERWTAGFRKGLRFERGARHAFRKGLLKGELVDLEPWLSHLPENNPRKLCLLAQAELLKASPDFKIAARRMATVSERNPDYWVLWSLSQLQGLAGDEEGARVSLARADLLIHKTQRSKLSSVKGFRTLRGERWGAARHAFAQALRRDPSPIENWANRELLRKMEKVAEVHALCRRTNIVTHHTARFRYHTKIMNPLFNQACRLWRDLTDAHLWFKEKSSKRWLVLLHSFALRLAESNLQEARDYRDNEENRSLHALAAVQNLLSLGLVDPENPATPTLVHDTCQRALDLVRPQDYAIQAQILLADLMAQPPSVQKSALAKVEKAVKSLRDKENASSDEHSCLSDLAKGLGQISLPASEALAALADPSLTFAQRCHQLLGRT